MSSPRNTLDILKLDAVGGEQDIIDCMVEVELKGGGDHDPFLSTIETLSRIGVYSPKDDETEKTLYQTCHILHKNGRYYIVHFKHLFMLDGHYNGFFREDILRMNQIIRLLSEWGLYKVVHPEQITEFAEMRHIKVIKHNEVREWTLRPKYQMKHSRNKLKQNESKT